MLAMCCARERTLLEERTFKEKGFDSREKVGAWFKDAVKVVYLLLRNRRRRRRTRSELVGAHIVYQIQQ